jgi:hypothetical protein
MEERVALEMYTGRFEMSVPAEFCLQANLYNASWPIYLPAQTGLHVDSIQPSPCLYAISYGPSLID